MSTHKVPCKVVIPQTTYLSCKSCLQSKTRRQLKHAAIWAWPFNGSVAPSILLGISPCYDKRTNQPTVKKTPENSTLTNSHITDIYGLRTCKFCQLPGDQHIARKTKAELLHVFHKIIHFLCKMYGSSMDDLDNVLLNTI